MGGALREPGTKPEMHFSTSLQNVLVVPMLNDSWHIHGIYVDMDFGDAKIYIAWNPVRFALHV